jgi:hypothetical protein
LDHAADWRAVSDLGQKAKHVRHDASSVGFVNAGLEDHLE